MIAGVVNKNLGLMVRAIFQQSVSACGASPQDGNSGDRGVHWSLHLQRNGAGIVRWLDAIELAQCVPIQHTDDHLRVRQRVWEFIIP